MYFSARNFIILQMYSVRSEWPLGVEGSILVKRRDLIEAINAPVRDVLVRARAGMSIEQAAEALGTSPRRLRYIEANPARIPCRDLYQIFQHLGPEVLEEADRALTSAQLAGFIYRSQRSPFSRKLDLWRLHLRVWNHRVLAFICKDWPLVLGLLLGRAIYDLAVFLYRK